MFFPCFGAFWLVFFVFFWLNNRVFQEKYSGNTAAAAAANLEATFVNLLKKNSSRSCSVNFYEFGRPLKKVKKNRIESKKSQTTTEMPSLLRGQRNVAIVLWSKKICGKFSAIENTRRFLRRLMPEQVLLINPPSSLVNY